MTREDDEQDARLYPVKVTAALASLAMMAGYFVVTLTRGPNEIYTYVVGALTLLLAVAVAAGMIRHRKRHRLRR